MKIVSKRNLTLSIFEMLKNNEVLLNYFGTLNFELSNNLINNLNKSLEKSGVNYLIAKKIYSAFIEGVGNVVKYQFSEGNDSDYTIINVSKRLNGFHITLGNLIDPSKKKQLEKSVDELKGMTVEELQNEYTKRLSSADAEFDDSGHLGLLQIALDSGNNVNCLFYELETGDLFFMIEIFLENE